MNDGLNRYSRVDIKRERVSNDRQEFVEMKHKELVDRLDGSRKSRAVLNMERMQWSTSVLDKHQKHQN